MGVDGCQDEQAHAFSAEHSPFQFDEYRNIQKLKPAKPTLRYRYSTAQVY